VVTKKPQDFRLARRLHCYINSDPLKEETMSAEEAQKTMKQELEDTRNDLKRAADEIKLKLHLAGMDAKDAWDEVQPHLAEFERRFDAKAEEVGEELKALGNDIMQRLQNIKSKLSSE
jgi:seryl-tRNA synthetase